MMRRSTQVGPLGLFLVVLVWMASSSGWAALAPDQARLRAADALKEEYERLYGEGRYPEATEVAKHACSILEDELGNSSMELATCIDELGVIVLAQVGDYGTAELLHERALAIREKVLGHEHPDVATSLSNLAAIYQGQGDYGKAQPLFERALAIREKALGPNHPDVARSLNDLATLYKEHGEKTMEAYYRELAEGMGRGEAMQAVQLEMLRSEEFRRPKDWAAFIVSGDDGPMVFPEGEKPKLPGAGPPEIELDDKKGFRCAMTESADRRGSYLMILMGLLGLAVSRRRSR